MIKGLTLFVALMAVSSVALGQECSTGTHTPQRLVFKKAVVNSYPGGRWSSTRPRYGGRKVFSPRVKSRNVRQLDMPLERCAILAMTGIGIGYLGTRDDQWVGLPVVAVAVAMPFPGQSRQGQFSAKGRWRQKLLGLFGMVVSYGVGLGVGQNMVHEPQNL